MLAYPTIDPVMFSFGPFSVHWYGFMYILAFSAAWVLLKRRAALFQGQWTPEQIEDLIFKGGLGTILGGRLGYMLFYAPEQWLNAPWEVFYLWHGGMSFHGGLLGVLFAMAMIARQRKMAFLEVTDFIAPAVPIGIAFGRIGNFIGAQLYGRVTDMPWGMIFPGGGPLPRHPSQLYQASLEGLLLFIALWIYASKPRRVGAVSGYFALGYGIARFSVEFFREPDSQYGLLWGNFSMGQYLSLPLIVLGVYLLCSNKQGTTRGKESLCKNT